MAQPNNPPANPVPGAIYVEDITGIAWVWTGVSWLQAGGSGGYNSQVQYGMALTPGFYTGISGGGGGDNLATIATQYGPTPPVNPSFGQTWVDTTDPTQPVTSVWTSPGQWTKISDGVTNTFVATDAPTSPDTGDTWYETDTNTFYVWDGLLWRPITGTGGGGGTTGIISYSIAPVVGQEGAVYYNTTSDTFYISNGSVWEEILVAPDKDTNSIVALTAPTARADGSALQGGDLWVNSGANQMSYYSVSTNSWVRIASATAGDTHSFYQSVVPALRPNNDPLLAGDVWVNSVNSTAYVWTGVLWTPIAYANDANTNSIISATAPITRPGGEAILTGDLWVNSVTSQVSYWNGSSWNLIVSASSDTMSILTGGAPIQRPDGNPLQSGDQWINSTTGTLYYYDGVNWLPVSSGIDTHSIYRATVPTTRSNGDPLQSGDQWVNSGTLAVSVYTGSAWTLLPGGSDTHSFVASTAPTTRPDASALETGDIWIDSDDNKVYYRTAGSVWQLISDNNTHSIVSSTAPTTRPDTTALQTGDMWVDSDDNKVYYRTAGGTWQGVNDGGNHTIISLAAPTTRPDASTLKFGDLWVRSGDEVLHYWNGFTWISTSTDTQSIVAGLPPTTRDNTEPLQEGDLWINNTTIGGEVVSYWDGFAWLPLPPGAPATPTTLGTVYGRTATDPLALNVSLGYTAGENITTGEQNVLIGQNSGSAITTQSYNTSLGAYTLFRSDYSGEGNTVVGRSAGTELTTGSHNTFIGRNAGENITTGSGNTFVGYHGGDPTTSNQVILARSILTDNKVLQINENNAFGIPISNGSLTVDYGLPGEILVSQGPTVPPIWGAAPTDTHSILSSAAPSLRADGSALQAGDIWVDSDDSRTYYRDAANISWLRVEKETHSTLTANTIDVQTADYFSRTLSGNATFSFTNALAAPNVSSFILKLTNGGNFSVAWPGSVDWAGGTAPTLTTNGTDILGFFSVDAGANWYGIMMSKDAK